MYKIAFSDKAKNQLKKLPRDIKIRFGSVIERIRIRPFYFVKKKQGTLYFILRIGNYRAILDIRTDDLEIYVLEIDHRKNIYKN